MLETVQNETVRLLLNLRGRVSVSDANEQLGLQCLQDRGKSTRINIQILSNVDTIPSFEELDAFADLCFASNRSSTGYPLL